MKDKAQQWMDAPCGKCAGLIRVETDHWGTHHVCMICGATRLVTVNLVPDLWSESRATEGPGGSRGDVLNRPYGKVLPR